MVTLKFVFQKPGDSKATISCWMLTEAAYYDDPKWVALNLGDLSAVQAEECNSTKFSVSSPGSRKGHQATIWIEKMRLSLLRSYSLITRSRCNCEVSQEWRAASSAASMYFHLLTPGLLLTVTVMLCYVICYMLCYMLLASMYLFLA